MQIHRCVFQHLVKENKQTKKIKTGKHKQVSLQRDSAGMINGARTFHTWTIWETKLPAGTCLFFSPAIHKTQKEQPQSHKTLTALRALCRDSFAPLSHCELFHPGAEAKLRCNPPEGHRHQAEGVAS